jgi:phage terminase large subunit
MELLRQRDPDAYAHVWLGHCRQFLAGAIYANELRAAEAEGRIADVPYDPSAPVSCYFDLGWADCTSIWIVQHIANEVRMIDFIQDQQRAIGHYLHILRTRGYNVQTIWLPHDSKKTDLGTGRSVQELVRADGWHVRITPSLLVPDGINALRTIFPKIWIDQRRCADGLQSLRHYKFEVDANTGQFGRTPLHDHASHAADAARYCAVAMQEQRRAHYHQPPPPRRLDGYAGGAGWMRS